MTTSTTRRRGDALRAGDILIRDDERIRCGLIERSDMHPGFHRIDVEFGVLYVLDEDELEVEDETTLGQPTALQQAHADALLAVEGDSIDGEIHAWRALAEAALAHVPNYREPAVVYVND
ncbi:hypothetical protein [Dietzia sp. 179-F 9C3 NHS]|uniref:hypothetical protein n=1 Tax=Dietzia sp. 179-F 9C3 NHS TaxID=3374295 RepID=UPI00387964CE